MVQSRLLGVSGKPENENTEQSGTCSHIRIMTPSSYQRLSLLFGCYDLYTNTLSLLSESEALAAFEAILHWEDTTCSHH